jgi:hypothetical protein
MSRRDERGSLKGKYSLFVGCCANRLPHCLGGYEVHLDLKKFGQAVLKTNHIQQRQFLFVIKFRHQIDIGRIGRFSSGSRTGAYQMQRRRALLEELAGLGNWGWTRGRQTCPSSVVRESLDRHTPVGLL